MEIVRIFEGEDSLLTVKYDGHDEDEFANIFKNWTDIEYLNNFFEANESDLKRPYWQGISIEQAIIETRREALKFRGHLKKMSARTKKERISVFTRLFQPLSYYETEQPFLNKKKAYGLRKRTWLRLYAIKISDEMFIITGGTIKLTDRMDERTHTVAELKKLQYCRDFLRKNGVIDDDGILELLEL
jgi:hypothetical protein